jgi:hypothetical protein
MLCVYICISTSVRIHTSFLSVRFVIVIAHFQVIIATNCPALTHCMIVSYVVCHKQRSSSISVYRVHSVSTDNILMWICEV